MTSCFLQRYITIFLTEISNEGICVLKLRRALALSLILQIYSLTKLENKIVFFLASLSKFRSHYLSDLRQKFRKWKFQIKVRIGKVRHCPLSRVTEQQNIFLKIMITSIIVIWWSSSSSRLSSSAHLLCRSRTSSSRCRWKRAWSLCWSLRRSPGWASSWNNLWCL